jgi:hypothetical protein
MPELVTYNTPDGTTEALLVNGDRQNKFKNISRSGR